MDLAEEQRVWIEQQRLCMEEQRVCVKFCYKLGKTPTETHQLLQKAYGNDVLSKGNCFKWYKRFKEGRESYKDDKRPGRPVTSITEENVARIRELISANEGLSVREIAETVGISYGSCQDILHRYTKNEDDSPATDSSSSTTTSNPQKNPRKRSPTNKKQSRKKKLQKLTPD